APARANRQRVRPGEPTRLRYAGLDPLQAWRLSTGPRPDTGERRQASGQPHDPIPPGNDVLQAGGKGSRPASAGKSAGPEYTFPRRGRGAASARRGPLGQCPAPSWGSISILDTALCPGENNA